MEGTMEADPRFGWRTWVTRVALLLAAVLIAALTRQLDSSRREVRLWRDRASSLVLRSYAAKADVRTVDGRAVQLGHTEARGQLYLVYRTDCAYCERSLLVWKSLAKTADSSAVEVLGISLDSEERTQRYQTEHQLPFPSIVIDDQRLRDVYRFWTFPQTIILDADGRVVFTRIGVMERGPVLDTVRAVLETVDKPRLPATNSADGRAGVQQR